MALAAKEEKKALRQTLLASRQALSAQEWRSQSRQICEYLANYPRWRSAQTVLAYNSIRQEPDLSWLWHQFPEKTWGFSRCVEQSLIWHQVPTERLEESTTVGKFGVREPLANLPLIDLTTVDLVLIPAIACDYQGYRLGYGGGFYDRFLATQQVFGIGIVFAHSLCDRLPHEPWDIPIQAICTEQAILEINS